MKNRLRLLIPLLGVVATLPLAQAEQEKKLRVLAEPDASGNVSQRHLTIRHDGKPPEMQKVAFLGVETVPVAPELTAQLNLPDDAGLVVRHLVPDSPAAAVLREHDILLKLDDQILIDSRQFSVLVRRHKAGDEVTLTYLRGGKDATAKVKLTEREVPKLAFFGESDGGGGNFKYFNFAHTGGMPLQGEDLKRTLSLLDRAHAGGKSGPGPRHLAIDGPGFRSLTVNTGNSNMVFSDEAGSLELTMKDGKKTLVAKNAKGEPLYSGPIDTPEQHQALPAEVRTRLEKLEGMQEFSFQADDVEPNADILLGTPSGIALPLPPSSETMEASRPQAL